MSQHRPYARRGNSRKSKKRYTTNLSDKPLPHETEPLRQEKVLCHVHGCDRQAFKNASCTKCGQPFCPRHQGRFSIGLADVLCSECDH